MRSLPCDGGEVSANLHRRGLAAVIAAVCLVAQFATLAHRAAVHHVVCTEHGELVEAAGATTANDAGDGVRLVEAERSAANPNDDHCVLACGLRAHTVSAPTMLPLVFQSQVFSTTASIAVGHIPSLARYRTAPKTSPPLA